MISALLLLTLGVGDLNMRIKPGDMNPGAAFGTPQCIPTGASVSKASILTVTRASTQYVDRANVNQQTPGLIAEDANTVAHVYWNGSALVDTKSNAWTQNGTVPQNAATWNAPPSAGPYSVANNYQGPTSLMEWSGASPFQVSVVFTPTSFSTTQTILSKSLNYPVSAGWALRTYTDGSPIFDYNDGASRLLASAVPATLYKPNVITVWNSGGSCYIKVNGGASASLPCAAITSGSAYAMRIGGNDAGALSATTTTIHEVYATTTPFSETTVAALQASVMAKINQGTLTSCPANSLAVSAQGAEVWALGVNYALQSSTMSVAPWVVANSAALTASAGVAPDGSTTAVRVANTGVGGGADGQTITVVAGTTYSASMWILGEGAVTTAEMGAYCGATDAWRATSAFVVTGTASISLNATPRAAVTGLSSAAWSRVGLVFTPPTSTSCTFYVYPVSAANSTAGTSILAWGTQVEVGSYPTPYIPTTTGTGTRPATVASVPLPPLHTTNNWCVGVTATPGGGRAWAPATGSAGILGGGAAASANSFELYTSGGFIRFAVWNNATAAKYSGWTYGGGMTPGSTHRIVGFASAGTLSLYVDGVSVGTTGGVGDGLLSSTPAALHLGSLNGSFFWDGSAQNAKIVPNAASWTACR